MLTAVMPFEGIVHFWNKTALVHTNVVRLCDMWKNSSCDRYIYITTNIMNTQCSFNIILKNVHKIHIILCIIIIVQYTGNKIKDKTLMNANEAIKVEKKKVFFKSPWIVSFCVLYARWAWPWRWSNMYYHIVLVFNVLVLLEYFILYINI